jgi:hypothetical protein
MEFNVDDVVRIKADGEELKSELFQAIAGAKAKVSEVYSTRYEPDVKRYEVTLERAIEINGENRTVIPGLYGDNLEAYVEHDEKDEINERMKSNRAITSFAAFNESLSTAQPKWYFGLADCLGIDSFIEEPAEAADWADFDELFHVGLLPKEGTETAARKKYNGIIKMLKMRAQANPQRWPIIYRVQLAPSDATEVENLVNYGEYDEALSYLKQKAITVQLARGTGGNAERRWNEIPNLILISRDDRMILDHLFYVNH